MDFCSNCGTEVRSSDKLCGTCGTSTIRERAVGDARQAVETPQSLSYRISLTRIPVMTVLSYGFYLFYWFGTKAFPVWHALTLIVPIYALLRTHAHMRSFKELMLGAGLHTTISTGAAVLVVLISLVLDENSTRRIYKLWGDNAGECGSYSPSEDYLYSHSGGSAYSGPI